MKEFPQITQSLNTVESSVAQLYAALRDAQSDAGQTRINTSARNVNSALQTLGSSRSEIENYGGSSEDAKKKTLQTVVGPISNGLNQFAKAITNVYERGSLPDNVASVLKSVLAKYEEIQKSYQKLAIDNGVNLDLYMPGLSHTLPVSVEDAFGKLGGR